MKLYPYFLAILVLVSCQERKSENSSQEGFETTDKSQFISKELYKDKYDSICRTKDKGGLFELIKDWEHRYPGDPEMYIAFFNYHLSNSKKEIVQLDSKPGDGKNLTLTDSSNQVSGYLYSKVHFDSTEFMKAQKALLEGLKRNPDRLDMYFGRIYSLREAGFYDQHKEEIIRVINLHKKNSNQWLWSQNRPLEDPVTFFKNSIQEYNYALFNLNEPRAEDIIEISKAMIELYSDDLRYYSNIGAANLIKKDLDAALKYFFQALELNQNDALVLSNIAWTYKLKGDNGSSIKYYQKVLKVGDQNQVNFAKQRISELQ